MRIRKPLAVLIANVMFITPAVQGADVVQSDGAASAINRLELPNGQVYDVLFRNGQGFQICEEDPAQFPFVGDEPAAETAAKAIEDALNDVLVPDPATAMPEPSRVGDNPLDADVAGWYVVPFTNPCPPNGVANVYSGEFGQAVSGDIPNCDVDKWDICQPAEFIETSLSSFPAWAVFSPSTIASDDITSVADITGDTVADVAGFGQGVKGKPDVMVYSGATGDVQSGIDYFNVNWQGRGLGTVLDADQDGTPNDPAVSMLAVNKTTSKIRVETRFLSGGAFVSSVQFLSEKWRVVDLVVVDDLNGDGNTSDSAIAVLAERISDGRIQLQLRDLVSGGLISNTVYLNARWTPVAAAVAARVGAAPLIGVIAEKAEDGRRVLQSRVAGSGAYDQNVKVLGSAWDFQDVSVNYDANSDGTPGDSVWVVLAKRASDDFIRVQSRFVSDGSFDTNTVILNSGWESFRMDVGLDMGGAMSNEYIISAKRRSDGVRRIHVKDAGTGTTTINIAP